MNPPAPTIIPRNNAEAIEFDWGQLTWFVNRTLVPAADMTFGRCIIRPGRENPRHHHPNCSEILFVQQGAIEHTTAGGTMTVMTAGDSISIPPNFIHQARNIGGEDAVLMISFSSPDRETRGED